MDISLSLHGAGTRGTAYVGAIRALREEKINPSLLMGGSSGAIVAAAVAFGLSDDEILKIFKKMPYRAILAPNTFYKYMYSIFQNAKIEEAKSKLIIQVTDFKEETPVLMESGSVAKALTASANILYMRPYYIEGKPYTDAGLSQFFATNFIRNISGNPIVCLGTGPAKEDLSTGILSRFVKGYNSLRKQIYNYELQLHPPDLLIENLAPDCSAFSKRDLENAHKLGYSNMKKEISKVYDIIKVKE